MSGYLMLAIDFTFTRQHLRIRHFLENNPGAARETVPL